MNLTKNEITEQDLYDKIRVYFDGSCAPGPGGNIGYGYVVYFNTDKLHEYSGFAEAHPDNTSNVGEYMASYEALKWLFENGFKDDEIVMLGDSMLVVQQMNRKWNIKVGKCVSIAKETRKFLFNFTNICFRHVRRNNNKEADKLSAVILEQKNLIVKRR